MQIEFGSHGKYVKKYKDMLLSWAWLQAPVMSLKRREAHTAYSFHCLTTIA